VLLLFDLIAELLALKAQGEWKIECNALDVGKC
jgi:hypothetical protein